MSAMSMRKSILLHPNAVSHFTWHSLADHNMQSPILHHHVTTLKERELHFLSHAGMVKHINIILMSGKLKNNVILRVTFCALVWKHIFLECGSNDIKLPSTRNGPVAIVFHFLSPLTHAASLGFISHAFLGTHVSIQWLFTSCKHLIMRICLHGLEQSKKEQVH